MSDAHPGRILSTWDELLRKLGFRPVVDAKEVVFVDSSRNLPSDKMIKLSPGQLPQIVPKDE